MKKGISLITLIITIVVIIILAAAVILTLGSNNPINSSKIASLVESKGSMDSSISLMISKLMADTVGETTTEKVVKERVAIDDTTGIQVVKNGMNYEIYPISAEKFKNVLAMDIENTPSKNSSWYVSTTGKVFLVYQSIDQVPMSLKEDNAINSSVDPFIILLESVEESEILGQVQITQDGSSNVNYNDIENGELNVTVPEEITLKWEINQSAEKLGTDEAKYTNNLVDNKINLTTSPAGKYYLHMLVSKEDKKYEKVQEYSVEEKADVWDGVSVAESFAGGTGTESDPYIISNAAELIFFRNIANNGGKYYSGTNDIYGSTDFTGKYIKLIKDIDLANIEFEPIVSGNNVKRFQGNFDGENHKILNIKITSETYAAGLFGKIKNAVIKNLITYGNIDVVSEYTGGIVARVEGASKIINCTNYININQTSTYQGGVGGIIGSMEGSDTQGEIIDCKNYGNLQSKYCVGGIVGRVIINKSIINCHNFGELTSTGNTGGISGRVDSMNLLEKSSNNAKVIGKNEVGGLIGSIQSSCRQLNYSFNTGEINSLGRYAGGIVGYSNNTSIITSCYNTGKIVAESGYCAGITGNGSSNAKVYNSYNIGSIISTSNSNYRGGIRSGSSYPYVYTSYYLDTSCDRIDYGNKVTATSGEPKEETLFKKDYKQTDSVTYLLNNGVTDDTRIWTIDPSKNDGYPILKWQVE